MDVIEALVRNAEPGVVGMAGPRMADGLRSADIRIEILNDVVLDQILVRLPAPDDGNADARTREVIAGVQKDGTCWLSGTTWHGKIAMRISIVNWSTTEDDVDRTIAAILKVARVDSPT